MTVHVLRPFSQLEAVMRKLIVEARRGNLVEVRVTAGTFDGRVEHYVIEQEALEALNVSALD